MKKFNIILLLMALLLSVVILFGCADPGTDVKEDPAGDRVEEEAKGEEEKKEDKEEKQEETTGAGETDAQETTALPEDTTTKPADTTTKPVVTTKPADTTAKPVVTTKPAETTAKPVVTTKPADTTAKPAKPKDEGPDLTLTAPSAATAQRIAEDYAVYMQNKYGYDPEIYGPYPVWYCYGSVNGAYAVIFGGATHEGEKAYFDISHSRHIKIWKNGTIYAMQEAFDKGVLTEKQMRQLEENWLSQKFVAVTKPYSDVNVPAVEKPSDEFIEQIGKDYTEYLSRYDSNCEGYVVRYYGEFGDCVPCLLDGKGLYYIHASVSQIIGPGVFSYSEGNAIKVWKDGEFYSLKEAYENGFLSVEDVLLLSKIHATGKYYKCR